MSNVETVAEVLAEMDKLIAQNPLHDVSIGGFKAYLGHLIDFRDRLERAMSAQGEAVAHHDIDECALEIARKFTPDNDPQARAKMQCAVIDAVNKGRVRLDFDEENHATAMVQVVELLDLDLPCTQQEIVKKIKTLTDVSAASHPDDLAVDRFAAAMKEKLAAARAKGRGGWDDKEDLECHLSNLLRAHVEKGDPRDVANFCCFLWNRGESIQPAPARVTDAAVKAVDLLKGMRARWLGAAEDYGMQGIIYADQLLRDATDEIDSVRATLTSALEAK